MNIVGTGLPPPTLLDLSFIVVADRAHLQLNNAVCHIESEDATIVELQIMKQNNTGSKP